jgi:hypothetical protein
MARHGRLEITEEQRSEAEDVLVRYYQQWVDRIAMSLAEQVIAGEIDDRDGLMEQMEQDTDSALTYTKDQHLVIQCSNSVSEGESRMEDMGGGGDNPAAVLAVLTMQADVQEELERLGLGDDFDREEWLAEVAAGDHGEELVDAATKALMSQVTKLIGDDPELAVAWDEHIEAGGSAAEFLEEHGE